MKMDPGYAAVVFICFHAISCFMTNKNFVLCYFALCKCYLMYSYFSYTVDNVHLSLTMSKIKVREQSANTNSFILLFEIFKSALMAYPIVI